jgi:3-deoxy-D-manno-octulosonic acid (KDO) 8-phosphate synthase
MNYTNWSEQDLEELDAKFDALCEHLGIEFVFEKISDGSDKADRSSITVRPKYGVTENQMATKITKKPKFPREWTDR